MLAQLLDILKKILNNNIMEPESKSTESEPKTAESEPKTADSEPKSAESEPKYAESKPNHDNDHYWNFFTSAL